MNIISGLATLLQQPARLEVSVLDRATGKQLGFGFSDAASGNYSVEVGDFTGECTVVIAQPYGSPFAANASVNEGEVIHPGINPFAGFVYTVLQSGVLPSVAPAWWSEGDQLVGTARLRATPYYQPQALGPVWPVPQ